MEPKNFYKSFLTVTLLLFFAANIKAQVPSSYLCSIRNDSLVNSRVYEFDIYLLNTDQAKPFELDLFQMGILVNPAIVNGGTISASIVSGSSQLVAVQQASAITFSTSQNCIKLAPGGSAPHGSASIISIASPGTRIARIRLTNTVDFGQFAPNFVVNFTPIPYNTCIFAKNQTYPNSSVNITNQANHSVSTMSNPVFNAPITAFDMTGGGTDCNYTGVNVGLSGSEPGVRYQLLKNTVPASGYISGTGSAISFGLQTTGTYTSTAYRKGTYITQAMSGSADVLDPGIIPVFSQLGPYCQNTTADVLPLISTNGISGTWNSSIKTINPGTTVYKFTPAAGQCALTATMSILVNPVYSFSESHSICAGSNFLWQGTEYSAAGIYHSNYQTAYGCDSTYTLNLTVNPSYSVTDNQIICEGQSYPWQGHSYSEAGTYYANYLTSKGCDSIYTLNLSVTPSYNYVTEQSICQGESFTWRGTSYTGAGSYHQNYQTVHGCDSIYTLNLSVNPVYSFVENQIIDSNESYFWHGTEYTVAGTYHVFYSTIRGCDSTYTLNLAINSGSKSLSLKVFIEGLYIGNGLMRQAMNDQGAQFSSGIADTLAVELHDAVSPFSVAYTFNNINLYTDGTITINDIPLSISGSYYLVLKHRNSIETWSSDIINFNSSGIIRYNFTDASSKAYDNNMKLMQGNVYAVYSGDVIKDGLVDGSDLAVIDNATINILKGYRTEDINGDGLVDGSDLVIIDNNSTSIVKVHKPLLP